MNNQTIVYIENAGVKVGILPHLGGTIVFVSKNNSPNILHENVELWNSTPNIDSQTDFIPLQGHTVWVGPQSEWWIHQNENAEKKHEQASWPPDPYITLGAYTILAQNEWSIKIQSPHSPIWGICLEKEIAVNPDGSIFVQATLTNTSQEPCAWDIWHNTRLPGYAKVYVPCDKKNTRVQHVEHKTSVGMPYQVDQGFFSFQTQSPPEHVTERSSKAFIYPSRAEIFAFTQNFLLTISFEKHLKQQIHPEQALVEIYNHTEHSSDKALVELEYHSPYTTLVPGHSIQAWEVWTLDEYSGDDSAEAHVTFINNYCN